MSENYKKSYKIDSACLYIERKVKSTEEKVLEEIEKVEKIIELEELEEK